MTLGQPTLELTPIYYTFITLLINGGTNHFVDHKPATSNYPQRMKNIHRPQLLHAPISLKTQPRRRTLRHLGELHQVDGGDDDGNCSLPVAAFSLSARRSPTDYVDDKKSGCQRDNSQFNNIGKQTRRQFFSGSFSLCVHSLLNSRVLFFARRSLVSLGARCSVPPGSIRGFCSLVFTQKIAGVTRDTGLECASVCLQFWFARTADKLNFASAALACLILYCGQSMRHFVRADKNSLGHLCKLIVGEPFLNLKPAGVS
jgi:hypothetical protein